MQNDDAWRMFVTAIWKYQYTKHRVELTDKMIDALFEEAVGIPFLAVNIYKLVQEYAIYSGEETFTPQSFHTIASQKMKLTLGMRRSLLSGKDINLQQYLDLTPFHAGDFKQTISQEINPLEPNAPVLIPKPGLREMAVQALLAFGLDRPCAMKYVNRTLARFPSCSHSSILAREAYDDFRQHLDKEKISSVSAKKALADSYSENHSNGFIGL